MKTTTDIKRESILQQLPVDYYQQGTKSNLLQIAWHNGKKRAVFGFIDDQPKKILDVGCASGWFLFQVFNRFPNARCNGVDLYRNAINYGKKLYPNLKLSYADAHKLPYLNHSFDLIICTEVIEHVDDIEKVLQEIKRVLQKDGTAIIEVDSGSWLFKTVWSVWTHLKGAVWQDAHMHDFSLAKLEKVITKTGFRVVQKKRFNLRMAVVYKLQTT